MSCELLNQVALYADDELDPPAHDAMAEHLSGCPYCSAKLAAVLDIKRTVRVAGKQFNAPAELHAAVFKQLRGEPVRPWWKTGLVPITLALVAVLGFMLWPRAKEEPMLAGLVDQHVSMLATSNLDVLSSDRHAVKPWYQGKLPFTFNQPELAKDSPFKLLGGKLVYLRQKPGAELVYQAGQHKISVFIFQAEDRTVREPAWNHDLSFTVSSWSAGGRQCYLVTDASRDEAGQLVTLFRDANRS
jgi:anti-sigma factor RsiW